MQKRMRVMLISVGVLFGAIFLYKIIMGLIINHAIKNQVKIINVSTMTVDYEKWQPQINASGSLRAIRGVNVTTELAGMVQSIHFTPGATVTKDEPLAQLNADNDIALLHSLQANKNLAQITYSRDKAQYAIRAVSKQVLDSDAANLKSLEAQVEQQKAIVAKKSIRAPFAGRLGVNNINPGQFVNPGDTIVTLQTLDPIYVDFFVPQQTLAQLKQDQKVELSVDTFPKRLFQGKISTINPIVDSATRNIQIEATIENPKHELLPGMFSYVEVVVGEATPFLTVPQTAISFNPYGSIVFIVKESGKDDKGNPILTVRQHFVTTGETRGDQIKVIKGLNKGDVIVTSGQLKLKNDTRVAVNNAIQLPNNPNPKLNNNH